MADNNAPFFEPIAPDTGALPVYDSGDVSELVPAPYRKDEGEAPILGALIEALTEIAIAWEDAGSASVAQSSIATASGVFLDGLAEDCELHRAQDEEQEAFRERTLEVPDTIDRRAILEAANAILAPLTTVQAHIFDSILDRWFVTDGTASFHSFIGANPQYFDRLYPQDAATNGASRPLSEPGGAYAFADRIGRQFVLRVPNVASVETVHAYCFDESLSGPGFEAVPYPVEHRLFVGDGTQSAAAMFVSRGSTALSIYQAIVDNVNALCGHGVRWALVVDSKLI